MAIIANGEYGRNLNCLETDLVNGKPPIDNDKINSTQGSVTVTVYNSVSKELESVFKRIDVGAGDEWMKLL